jgi:hypothetical protein
MGQYLPDMKTTIAEYYGMSNQIFEADPSSDYLD